MTAITKLGAGGTPFSKLTSGRYDGKTIATAFQDAILIFQFDLWREGYAGAIVEVFKEGTTTRADIYTDVNLSSPADNPQTLLSQTLNGRSYGKFQESLYTPDAYYLQINGIESTGVFYPGIRTLDNKDALGAYTKSSRGGVNRTLGERAGDTIHVLDFGNFSEIDGSTTENTTTLTAALGVAASNNGGEVILPAGTYKISTIDLPANVVLRGQGREATVLQSEEADNIVTVTGDSAGLMDLCLDGINLEPSSVGVYTLGVDMLRMSEVTIKRFEVGLKAQGGLDHHYTNLFIINCTTCADLRGDTDATSTALGGIFGDLTWQGGSIEQSTSYGMRLRYVDAAISGLTIRDISFTDNVGTTALSLEGCKAIIFEDNIFSGNIIRHVLTADVTATTGTITVENVEFRSCDFGAREIKLGGTCKDFLFDRCTLAGALSINANTPLNPILFRDSIEATTVTQTGNTDKICRWTSVNNGVFVGTTASGTSTATVFKRKLDPGETVQIEIMVSAVQRNLAAHGTMKKSAAAYNPAAQLAFDAQTANFTAGNTVTGQTSGATAIIQTQTDAGVTGLLNLIRVVGTFQDNELIVDSGSGSATVDGVIALQNSVILVPVQYDYFAQSAGATTWDVDVTTSTQEVQIKVIGVTTGTVDWNVKIRQTVR